jgi:hypothetical protein
MESSHLIHSNKSGISELVFGKPKGVALVDISA